MATAEGLLSSASPTIMSSRAFRWVHPRVSQANHHDLNVKCSCIGIEDKCHWGNDVEGLFHVQDTLQKVWAREKTSGQSRETETPWYHRARVVGGLNKVGRTLGHFRDHLKSMRHVTCNWTPLEERVANTNNTSYMRLHIWLVLVGCQIVGSFQIPSLSFFPQGRANKNI